MKPTRSVDRPEQHDQAGELQQRLALGLRAGPEVQGRRVLEDQEQRDLALLHEFLAIGLAEAGGDVPVDVADVVAELILHHLVELDAAAAEGRAVFAAEDVLDGVAHAPLQLPQQGQRGGRDAMGGAGQGQASAGTGVAATTRATIWSAVTSSASAS